MLRSGTESRNSTPKAGVTGPLGCREEDSVVGTTWGRGEEGLSELDQNGGGGKGTGKRDLWGV